VTAKKTVFIMGAGASAHAGVPMIRGFLDKVRDMESNGSGAPFQADYTTIVDLIRSSLTAIPAARRVDLHNVEEVFSLIEMGRLIRRIPGVKEADLDELAASMRIVLAHTVDTSSMFPCDRENGVMAPHGYERLADFIADRSRAPERRYSFITFNYDLALDAAIVGANMQLDYGLESSITPATVPILKLHGSINWRRENDDVKVLSVDALLQRAGNAIRYGVGRPLSLRALNFPGVPARPDVALIPPSWNKTQDQGTFGNIWRHAGEELSSADSIVIIGYSAPRSDAFFSDLLALGLASASKSLRRIVLVDTNPSAAARFTDEILGTDTTAIFTQLEMAFERWADTFVQGPPPEWSV